MNKKSTHIFKGIDTDSSPMAVNESLANTIHNLRVTANEAYSDTHGSSDVLNTSDPVNTVISPELGTVLLKRSSDDEIKDVPFIFGSYVGHCVCNNNLVVFSIYEYHSWNVLPDSNSTQNNRVNYNYTDVFEDGHSYDMIVKYELKNIPDNLQFDSFTILAIIDRSSNLGEAFSLQYPIESLFCYENTKTQRLYFVDGKNQPRSINIADYIYEVYRADSTITNTFYTSYDDINISPAYLSDRVNFNCDIDITNTSSSNGEFKPGTIQYAITLVSNNDTESSIFYISPMYYLSPIERGESTDNMVQNTFTINITNATNYENFKRMRIYAIARTSEAAIVTRLISDRTITNNIIIVDDGKIGSTEDYTSLFYKGSERVVAYTLDQKDGTLFLGNLKYKPSEIPALKGDEFTINLVALDYYGHAIYDYAGYKKDGSLMSMDLDYKQLFWNEGVLDAYSGVFEKKSRLRPDITLNNAYGYYNYTFKTPLHKKYYEHDFENTRSARAIKRFKSGEYYKLGLVGQLDNGKFTDVLPLNIVYNPYKPIFTQYVNTNLYQIDSIKYLDVYKGTDKESCDDGYNALIDELDKFVNQRDCFLTTGFRVLIKNDTTYNSWISRCKRANIVKLYPVVVYPNSAYKAVLTQGILSPTVFNVREHTNTRHNISSWYYRPYAKGILNDNHQFKGSGTSGEWTVTVLDNDHTPYNGANDVQWVINHPDWEDDISYTDVYNLSCITSGSHYRALYSSSFPNGEIESNIVGCPVNYLMMTYNSDDLWGHYGAKYRSHSLSGTALTNGNRSKLFIHPNFKDINQIRIMGPTMYSANKVLYPSDETIGPNNPKFNDSWSWSILTKEQYSKYLGDNFLMNCNLLTLNSPETESSKLLVNSVRDSLGNGYKLRLVGFSDYCTDRILYGKKGISVDEIKDKFRLAHYSKYYNGNYRNLTYLKNRQVKSEIMDGAGKRFWGKTGNNNNLDDGYISQNNIYLGDCTWSYTEEDRYNGNVFVGRKVSCNLAYGSTNYYIASTKDNGNIPMYDFKYVEGKVGGRVSVKDIYEQYEQPMNTDTDISVISIGNSNMFASETREGRGVRNTLLSNTYQGDTLFSSWASSLYLEHANDGPKGDADTVTNKNKKALSMYNQIPHICWWYPDDSFPETGSTDEPLKTILDCIPTWVPIVSTDPDSFITYTNSYYSKNKTVDIKYNSTPFIAISLGTKTKTNVDGDEYEIDNILANTGYGMGSVENTPYWIGNGTEEDKTYRCESVVDKLYGYLDMVGQFIGELYKDPDDIGIKFLHDADGNVSGIDYVNSTYMGGSQEDPFLDWIICGDPVDLRKDPGVVNRKTALSTLNDDGWEQTVGEYYELVYTEGDTYIGRFDSLKTYPYNEVTQSVVEIYSTVLESSINLEERIDVRKREDLEVTSNTNFNLYNEQAYNQTPALLTHHVKDINKVSVDNFPNTITWTGAKTFGADIDEWTHITMLSTMDLDGQYGVVRYLTNFNNSLYCFQDSSISLVNFNSRVTIPTSDNNPIEITNGYKVDGKTNITNQYGCSNKWSIITGVRGVYFVDDINNKACLFTNNQVNALSNTLGVQRFFNERHVSGNVYTTSEHLWYPVNDTWNYCRCFYDNRRNEVYYIFNDTALVFNETLGIFTGTFDYEKTKAMFNVGDYFGSIWFDEGLGTDEIYELFSGYDLDQSVRPYGMYGVFYTENGESRYKDYLLEYIEHGDVALNKTFNTVEWFSENNNMFNYISVNSVDFYSSLTPIRYGIGGNGIQRFNYYRVHIPQHYNASHQYMRARHSYPYCKISLYGTSKNISKCYKLHNITTTYSV